MEAPLSGWFFRCRAQRWSLSQSREKLREWIITIWFLRISTRNCTFGKKSRKKNYGSLRRRDPGIHVKFWQPCLAPQGFFWIQVNKVLFPCFFFPCFLLVEVHFLNPKLFDPLLWRGSGTRRYWSISIGAWPCRVPWKIDICWWDGTLET